MILVGPERASGHLRAGHPERPERVDAAVAGIFDLDLGPALVHVAARAATVDELARVHDRAYLGRLEAFCTSGGGNLDPDTYAEPASWTAACIAAGAGLAAIGAIEAAEAIDAGEATGATAARGGGPAFVGVRPPGHHALPGAAMGFCLLNNVAVAGAALAERGERVLVLDWDVHHGNGTQAIFWEDPRVLYVSTHQWPLYPGTGRPSEVGGAGAPGTTVNIPLPEGSTGDTVRRALGEVAWPVVERFSPTWVLVSAGFDAHREDPLSTMGLSAADFGALSLIAADMAGGARHLVLFLEGGYHLGALRASTAAALGALAGAGGSGRPAEPAVGGGRGGDRGSTGVLTSGGPGAGWIDRVAAERRAALEGGGGER